MDYGECTLSASLTFETLVEGSALGTRPATLLALVFVAWTAHGVGTLVAGNEHVAAYGETNTVATNLAYGWVVQVLARLEKKTMRKEKENTHKISM